MKYYCDRYAPLDNWQESRPWVGRSTLRMLALLAMVIVFGMSGTAYLRAETLFSNNNPDAVTNGPPNETTITLETPALISRIMTYHWNGGQGTTTVGTIALRGTNGEIHGPWQASGLPGQGGVANAYWEAFPTVSLPAGSYVVIDSDPVSWAHNGASNGAGIAEVEGYPQ